ncbi:MAG: aspartate-semialdehyde dehydrogenase [Turicibacter sp.]|nr:aspartate-semialdehyde dehydrogenase [Turicibacter sp.]
MKKYNVIIAGATGKVGQTFLKVIEEYNFPINELRLLASARSVGREFTVLGKTYQVEEMTESAFDGFDIAFFSAGGDMSKKFAPVASAKGVTVIDNSSAWRMDDKIGLVVPEINIEDSLKNKIIANPNCSTIQSVIPLNALKPFGIRQVNYTTYQAVSGSGQKGSTDLERTKNGEAAAFYPHNISDTVIPEIDAFTENGYTKEEMKMVNETRKILHLPELPVSATCVRVPIANGHGVMIQVQFDQDFELSEIKAAFKNQEGIVILDNGPAHEYPTATVANGTDAVYVGRIRKDLAIKNSLLFFCYADNIRKGAASNAVQIAVKMIEKGML